MFWFALYSLLCLGLPSVVSIEEENEPLLLKTALFLLGRNHKKTKP